MRSCLPELSLDVYNLGDVEIRITLVPVIFKFRSLKDDPGNGQSPCPDFTGNKASRGLPLAPGSLSCSLHRSGAPFHYNSCCNFKLKSRARLRRSVGCGSGRLGAPIWSRYPLFLMKAPNIVVSSACHSHHNVLGRPIVSGSSGRHVTALTSRCGRCLNQAFRPWPPPRRVSPRPGSLRRSWVCAQQHICSSERDRMSLPS